MPGHGLRAKLFVFLAGAALLNFGCASPSRKADPVRYSAQNAGDAGNTTSSDEGVLYNVPIGSEAEGDLRVIALGETALKTHVDGSAKLPCLHVRLIARNKSGTTDWNLDSRIQQITFSGATEPLRPAFVKAKNQSLPFVRVAKGKTVDIDLFYLLPAKFAGDAAPSFAFNWNLVTSRQSVAETTQFTRIHPETETASIYPFDRSPAANRAGTESGSSVSADTPLRRRHAEPAFEAGHQGSQSDWWQDPFAEISPDWPGVSE